MTLAKTLNFLLSYFVSSMFSMVFSVGKADILHNSSYNYGIGGASRYYNFYYVTWLGVVFGAGSGNSSLLF
jgi:hypothetical protein